MTAAAPPDEPRPTPAIGDIGRAFLAALSRAEVMAVVVSAVVGALVSILVNLAIALGPLRQLWFEVPTPWLSLSNVFFVLLLGVLWSVAAIAFVPGRVRPALEAFTWTGERSLAALRAATGSDDVPTSPDRARRWLERTPETAANRWVRVEALLLAGHTAEARATAERMGADDPVAAWQRTDALATVDIVATGSVDLAAYRASVAALEGEAALDGVASLAIMESRIALAGGGDWLAPLTVARERIGARADGILWRRYLWRRLRAALPIMGVVAIGLGLLGFVLG